MKKITRNEKLYRWMDRLHDSELIRFAGKTKPIREGWYYCEYREGYKGFYRFFDGGWWHDQSISSNVIELIPMDTPKYWFGLTKHYENYH